MANYGIGGRYTPHTDHGVLSNPQVSEYDLFRGDRILTFMTYVILLYAHVPDDEVSNNE